MPLAATRRSPCETTCDSRRRASFSDCLLSSVRRCLLPASSPSALNHHTPTLSLQPPPPASILVVSSSLLPLSSLSPRRTAVPQPLLLLPSFFPLKVPPVAFFRPAAKLDGASSVLHASSSSSFPHSPGCSFSLPSCWLGRGWRRWASALSSRTRARFQQLSCR